MTISHDPEILAMLRRISRLERLVALQARTPTGNQPRYTREQVEEMLHIEGTIREEHGL